MAVSLKPDIYQKLFELNLTEGMDAGELQRRIDRYNALTGRNYLDCYNTYESGRRFSLLVQVGIIDLWTAFQDSLAPDGTIAKPYLLEHIKNYVYGIKTIQAFRFIRQFLPQYGFDGVKQYFDRYNSALQDQLWSRKDYRGNEITLSVRRDFLADDPEGQLLMLYWVEEYFLPKSRSTILPLLRPCWKARTPLCCCPQRISAGCLNWSSGRASCLTMTPAD